MSEGAALKKTLGPLMIWGLGVGYVISGMYFGWNLGLIEGGPYGFLIAALVVTLMYVTFVWSYAELACAMPKAGGAFVYASKGLGRRLGFMAGLAQLVEFVFAPPAIAAAIGAYFALFVPSVHPLLIAMIAYAIFTGLNIYDVKGSAIFELVMTILAVGELIIFIGFSAPKFTWESFSHNPLPNGIGGIFAAIPFAIWFYLAIEGIANVAEEAKNPQRDMSRGFGFAMATLAFLAMAVLFCAVGVGGWEAVVYPEGSTEASDSPLPLALGMIVGDNQFMYHMLVTVGLFGLVASFHGIILASGRALLSFGQAGFAPKRFGQVHEKRKTPVNALLLNMCVGVVALLSGRTGDIIILAVFGALTLYILSMMAFFNLRKNQPDLKRPFVTPLVPLIPGTALFLSTGCFVAMAYYYFPVFAVYCGILALGALYYQVFCQNQPVLSAEPS